MRRFFVESEYNARIIFEDGESVSATLFILARHRLSLVSPFKLMAIAVRTMRVQPTWTCNAISCLKAFPGQFRITCDSACRAVESARSIHHCKEGDEKNGALFWWSGRLDDRVWSREKSGLEAVASHLDFTCKTELRPLFGEFDCLVGHLTSVFDATSKGKACSKSIQDCWICCGPSTDRTSVLK